MIKAACLTSLPPATTCRCRLSKLSTLVFRTTGCCGGPRRLPSRLRSTRTSRPWRHLDADEFRAALMSSPLCHPDAWTDLDADALVRLYDAETTAILDRFVPARTVTCRRRPSDPWFDQECRLAKRRVRQLERVARSADVNFPAVAEWTAERRAYRALLRRKREAFWTSKVESERSSPRQLWRSIDALMGRGRVPSSEVIGAAEFRRHFDAKVADVFARSPTTLRLRR